MGSTQEGIKMTKFSMPSAYSNEDPVEFKIRMFNKQRGFKSEVAEAEICRRRLRQQELREHEY
jgi:hypothetical protein